MKCVLKDKKSEESFLLYQISKFDVNNIMTVYNKLMVH